MDAAKDAETDVDEVATATDDDVDDGEPTAAADDEALYSLENGGILIRNIHRISPEGQQRPQL